MTSSNDMEGYVHVYVSGATVEDEALGEPVDSRQRRHWRAGSNKVVMRVWSGAIPSRSCITDRWTDGQGGACIERSSLDCNCASPRHNTDARSTFSYQSMPCNCSRYLCQGTKPKATMQNARFAISTLVPAAGKGPGYLPATNKRKHFCRIVPSSTVPKRIENNDPMHT